MGDEQRLDVSTIVRAIKQALTCEADGGLCKACVANLARAIGRLEAFDAS